jgi:hypothetical protein
LGQEIWAADVYPGGSSQPASQLCVLLEGMLAPHEALPDFDDSAGPQLSLDVASQSLSSAPASLQERSLLRAASSHSSAGECLPPADALAWQMPPGSAHQPQQDAQMEPEEGSGKDSAEGCATKKRRVGRPRCYDTTLPLLPGAC